MIRAASAVLFATTMLAGPALGAPRVVASTKPVHALVASVMQGAGEPALLVRGNASPHTYALRPSDAAALQSADVVFWTGPGMELFLVGALGTLAPGAVSVALADAEGLELLEIREGGAFEAHEHGDHGHDHGDDDHGHDDHEHDHHDHDHDHDDHDDRDHDDRDHDDHHDHAGHGHGVDDMHFWLDPVNGAVLLGAIAETLAGIDPDNAALYRENAERERAALAALDAELAETLAPVADIPFIVFHDAYQYFEARYGLTAAGSVTVSPEVMPGAQRINELRRVVTERGAQCVFAEPQFEPAIIAAIVEGTPARAGVLDPEGGLLDEGPGLYGELLRGLAGGLAGCLAPEAT